MQRTRSGGMPSKCGFCKRTKEDACSGEMLFSQDGQLVVHRKCLLFSFVPVTSKISKNENLCGISIQTIKKKLQKAAKMRCTHCHRSGAAVKCAVTYCRKVYHYPCVRSDNGAIKENEIHGVYRIWCRKHKTEQKLVEDSSFEHAEDVQDTAQPKGEMLERQEGQHLSSKKVDLQGHSSCMQTDILMKCEVKNCSKICHLGCATSNNIKLMKNVEKGIDSASNEDRNDKKAPGSTSGNCCMDSGDEESCNDWEDNLKRKMRKKTKDGCNNRNSNEISNIPERDCLEHSDMYTERIKGNTAELLQSKENPAKVAESEENVSCMDIHNLEKAKLFWNKMQTSGRVEHVFEQLSNVITCLKKKIANGSANNQEYLKALNLLNKAGIYNDSLSSDTAENEERVQLNCEDISERVINSEEIEAESVLDNPLLLQTSVIKSLASYVTCPSLTKELNYPSVPDQLIFHQHKCNTMCIVGVMPPTSDHFKGENPLKIPILCRFQRRHAKLHWDTEVLEPPHVSYKAPCGRSLRNFKEVRNYIYETQCGFLLLDFFSFNTYIQLSRTFPCKNSIVYEADISYGIEPVPVSLHNAIDTSVPEHFKYRKAWLPHGYLVSNSSEMFQQKCDCTDGCSDSSRCACQQLTAKVNKRLNKASGYEYKRLLQCAPSGLYECNKWCKCDKKKCENRVVQQGLMVRLQLFKTHKKGWGVRCMDDVDKGTFVCCYTGRILRTTNEIESQENEKAINVNDTDSGSSKTAMTFIKREKKDSNSEPECKLLQETEETITRLKKDEVIPFLKTSPLITQNMELSGRKKLRVCKSELPDSELTSIERPKTKTALLQARRRKLQEQGQKLFMHSSSEEDERESSAERPKRHSRTLLLSSPKKLKTLSDNHPINNDEGVSENKSSIDYRKSHSIPSGNILECPLFSQQAQQETDKQENKIDNENGNIQNKLIQDDNHKQPMSKLHRICNGYYQGDYCYLLDATKEGNIGRFLNHSCDPNLTVQSVFVDTHDKNFPWVAFFTNRYVKAGSELTWDYNYSVGSIPEEEIPCLCGSIKCRNIIVTCGLCLREAETQLTGKLFASNTVGNSIAAHQNCLLFSSNLVNQNSQDFDDFGGFLLGDIKKEIKRGSKLTCSFCKKKGATVGCEVNSCKRSYHYPCASDAEAKIIENDAEGIYRIYCKLHKGDENPTPSKTASSNIAGSHTDKGIMETKKNNALHQPKMSANINKRSATTRKRIISSDTDDSDDWPISTGTHIQVSFKSKNGSKQTRLENDDGKQVETPCNSSSARAKRMSKSLDDWSLSMLAGDSPGGTQEAQLREVHQNITEEGFHSVSKVRFQVSTGNPTLCPLPMLEKNESNNGNCSDSSTNIDQRESHEEIDDVQQGFQEEIIERTSTPITEPSVGQAANFWKMCKEAGCLENVFWMIQNNLSSIQQKIANGIATSKDNEVAWEILLTTNSLQEIMSEFQSQIEKNLQHLEEEKLSLQRQDNFVKELAKLAHSLNKNVARKK
ncbi:uncharacterized protein LOC144598444 [Rhinoraja longicauda]